MIEPKLHESWMLVEAGSIKGYLFLLECRENGVRKGFLYDFQTEDDSEGVSSYFSDMDTARNAAKEAAVLKHPAGILVPVLFLDENAGIALALVTAKAASALDYKELVEAGDVRVNGEVMTDPQFVFKGSGSFDVSTNSIAFRVLIG